MDHITATNVLLLLLWQIETGELILVRDAQFLFLRLFRAAVVFNFLQVPYMAGLGYGLGLGFWVVFTIIVFLTLTLTLITQTNPNHKTLLTLIIRTRTRTGTKSRNVRLRKRASCLMKILIVAHIGQCEQ